MKTLRESLRTGALVAARLTPAFFERERGAASHSSRPVGMATTAAAKPIKLRLVKVLNIPA
jgi:hypothetical protein